MTDNALNLIGLGWLAFAVAAISPGPNMVAVASRSLGAGRSAGQRVAIGIALGAFFWAALSVAGLVRMFERLPATLPLLSVFGGGYLCWLGIKGLRSAWRGGQSTIGASKGRSAMSDVLFGLSVTLSNPKVALLWATLATVVGPAVNGPGSALLFAAGSAALGYTIYGGYGLLFSSRGARSLYDSFGRTADAVFGGLFLSLGFSLMARSWT